MTLRKQFSGTGVAIVTPFLADGQIDWNSFRNIIDHNINGGVNYLVVLGTTGESATVHGEEKQRVFSFVKETVNGRCPLVAGIGNYDTRNVVNDLQTFDLTGYAAVLSVSPYYNKPSQEGLFQHFKAVNEATPLPVMIYNVPARTGQNMTAVTQLRIAAGCSNIFATKEASGNFEQVMLLLKHKPKDFMVISGDDGIALPMIAAGAEGVVSVLANAYPQQCSEMIRLCLQNKFDAAQLINLQFAELIPALFTEGSPSGIKAVLAAMNLCEEHCRLPVVPVSEQHREQLKELMKDLKI